jgi:hypothetical protein
MIVLRLFIIIAPSLSNINVCIFFQQTDLVYHSTKKRSTL